MKLARIGIVILANREISQQKQGLIKRLFEGEHASNVLMVAAFASFITFLQPFGMVETPLIIAWSFWLCICLSGYCIFSVVIHLIESQLSHYLPAKLKDKQWLILTGSTIIASVLMAFVAQLIVSMFFGAFDQFWQDIIPSFYTSLLIGGILTIASVTKHHLKQQRKVIKEQQQAISDHITAEQQQPDKIAEQLLSKLPIEKRGVLYCLEMDDHYLNVHTDKGNHLILMRFKDAVELLKDFPGCRVHRSWWVAFDAITSTKKDGRKLMLTLVNGLEVPVSKTYEAEVKANS